MADAAGQLVEVGCEVRVLAREFSGVNLPAYKAVVVSVGRDTKGPIVNLRGTSRKKKESSARPDGLEVTKGAPPPKPEVTDESK